MLRVKKALLIDLDGLVEYGQVAITDDGRDQYGAQANVIGVMTPRGWGRFDGEARRVWQFETAAWSFVLLHDDLPAAALCERCAYESGTAFFEAVDEDDCPSCQQMVAEGDGHDFFEANK